MFKNALFLFTAILIAVPQLAPGFQSPPQSPTQAASTTIRGSVTNAATSQGIAGAHIVLNPTAARGAVAADPQALREAAGRAGIAPDQIEMVVEQQAASAGLLTNNATQSFTVETDSSGQFQIESVPPGIYTLTATVASYLYLLPNSNGIGSETFNTQITVTAGKTVPDVSVRMVRGSTVSGRVSDASGQPARNVQVNALRLIYQQGRPILQSWSSKTTDDRGEFRLFYLPPGEYYIAAGQPGGARGPAARGAAVASNEIPVRTYYPGEIDPAHASKIRVGAGAELSGVNLTIQTARVFTIRGQITATAPITPVAGPNGQLIGGQVFMGLSPRNPSLERSVGASNEFRLDANGTAAFQIGNVLPGEYYLVGNMTPMAATADYIAPANSSVFARLPIDVRDNIDGLRFVISSPVDVKGSVVSSGPSVTRPAAIGLNLIDLTSYAGFLTYGRGQATAAADFTFVFANVPPGHYVLDANIPQNGQRGADVYVGDILLGGTSVIESGFTIDDKTPLPIQVVLNSGTGSVEGTAYASAQKPAPAAVVVLVPLKHRRMLSLYRTVTTDASGHFVLRGIPPADYELFSWEEYLPTAEQDDDYFEKYKNKGQLVTVRASSVTMADVRVIPRESSIQ